MGEPRAEVDIDHDLVRSLLSEQHPDLAGLPLIEVGSGWDNAIFRLGSDLCVRLPRRAASVPLISHEQRWLSEIAPRLTLPIPTPVRIGTPGNRYPWPWSVTPWFTGSTAETLGPEEKPAAARQLGEFLVELHQPAPPDAPSNPFRGVPLIDRNERMQERLIALDDSVDSKSVGVTWEALISTPPWFAQPVWLHGDLHPMNIVMNDGRVVAVIDFGDLCAGDPATDLAVAWMLFDKPSREEFRRAAQVDADTWLRARAWALTLGVFWTTGGPRLKTIGRRTLNAAVGPQ